MRKSYANGFVISLSGGADSAAVAMCCYLMIQLGIESIGLATFKQKLAYLTAIQNCESAQAIAAKLIHTAYQPTANSSTITHRAAESVAKAIGANFYVFAIEDLVKGYKSIVTQAIGQQLSWQKDDLALQNIQARTRAPSVWLLANLKSALLLATSNRSESAVGYATMDGDTSGRVKPHRRYR